MVPAVGFEVYCFHSLRLPGSPRFSGRLLLQSVGPDLLN